MKSQRRSKHTKKDLTKVTERDVALLIFVRTMLDNLDSRQQIYWHVLNIINRCQLFMKQMQTGSMSLKLKYKTGHMISDMAWDSAMKDGPMMISVIALSNMLVDQNKDRFDIMIGDTSQQVLGIANKFYNEEELKEVKLNSWKTMKRLDKHLNKTMYEYKKDTKSFNKRKII